MRVNLATLPPRPTGEGELPRGRSTRARRELARERVARRAGRPSQDGRQRVGLPHDARLGRAHERRGRRQVRRQEQERRGRVPGEEEDWKRAAAGARFNWLEFCLEKHLDFWLEIRLIRKNILVYNKLTVIVTSPLI